MADIFGTAASETLAGTSGDDTIVGGGGIDRIDGGPGNDSLTGGDESDSLYGEAGNDLLSGGDGSDTLHDGAGNDVVHGDDGNDLIQYDGPGVDQLYGDGGDDTINIVRRVAGSTVTAFGGTGNDSVFIDVVAGNTVTVDLGDGDDIVQFQGIAANVTATLGAGRDIIEEHSNLPSFASQGYKVIFTDFAAGAGGDIFDASTWLVHSAGWNGTGNPFASGLIKLTQSGSDVVLSLANFQGVLKDVAVFQDTTVSAFSSANFGGYSLDGSTDASVTITGTAAGEVLTGGSGDDLIEGLGGNDTIFGGDGADTIDGGDDDDVITGGGGNDLIEGGSGADRIESGFGDDEVHGGDGDDVLLDVLGGADSLYGDAGNDVIDFQRYPEVLGAAAFLSGGAGDDAFYIAAYNGSLAIDGGADDDFVAFNQLGSNTLAVAATVTFGAGIDALYLSADDIDGGSTITITDFQTGAGGDRIDTYNIMNSVSGWVWGSNPFVAGWLRVVQNGADVLFQLDSNGGGDNFVTLVTFQNSSAAAFTAFNLGGFAPDGTIPAGQTLTADPAGGKLRGDEGDDTITGGAGADTIWGFNGDDEIDGGGEADILLGGMGNDHLVGGDGDDLLSGSLGDDHLEGGEGKDELTGSRGSDILSGGGGDDYIWETSSTGFDTFHGGDGDDTIDVQRSGSGVGLITVTGDAGNDSISVSVSAAGVAIAIDSGDGNDRVALSRVTSAAITLGAGADVIDLSTYTTPGAAVTIVDFQAGAGGDSLDLDRWLSTYATIDSSLNPFGNGYLKLVQSGADTIVQFDRDGSGTAYAWVNLLTLQNVDMLTLRAANLDNYQLPFQFGTESGDTLEGTDGADTLYGEGGDDVIRGLAGADNLYGGDGADQIEGAAGADTIQGDAGDDVLDGGADNDILHGNVGDDTVGGGDGDDDLYGDDGADSLDGGAGFDILEGGLGDDLMNGGGGTDYLVGGIGDDTMDGGEGNDQIYSVDFDSAPQHDSAAGGSGIDVLVFDLFDILAAPGVTISMASDPAGGYSGTVASGADYSVAFTGIEIFGLFGTDNADQLTTGDFDDLLVGRGGGDTLTGGGGNDWLIGGTGADLMTGGTGNDRYEVSDSGDVVVEAAGEGTDLVESWVGSYTLLANFENLTGLSADGQTLTGNDLNNVITAGAGSDVLDGGLGADSMSGGAGNDVFYVDNAGDVVSDGGGNDEIRTSLATFSMAALSSIEHLTGIVDTGQTLTGNSLGNTMRGAGGDDQLNGGGAVDTLYGGAGNDQLDGGTGGDTMRGEQGDDSYTVDSSLDAVIEVAGEGTDKVLTALASYTLGSNLENLTGTAATAQSLRGNSLDNVVSGGVAGDTIRLQDGGVDKASGNGGNDILFFGPAMTPEDEADGGSGTDTLVLQGDYSTGLTFGANAMVGVETLQLLTRTNLVYGGGGATPNSYALALVDANVAAGALLTVDASGLAANESLAFNGMFESDGRFAITGGLGSDTLIGGAGIDTISGGGGNDLIDGGAGADTLSGGLGDDVFIVDTASDVVVESAAAGTDEIRTALASYTLATANVEVLRGTSSAGQLLTGGLGGLTIYGEVGSDTLDDGAASASLRGGVGDDLYLVRSAGTTIVEALGEGNDQVRSYVASLTLAANLESLVGMLATGQTLIGNGGTNVITGGDGNDRLDGGGGFDGMTGGLGDDTYVIDNSFDMASENEGEGSDRVETTLAAYTLGMNLEKLTGTSSAGQALTGNHLDNEIAGGAGSDVLNGGGGTDSLSGNGGDDRFLVSSPGAVIAHGGTGTDTLVVDYSASGGAVNSSLSGSISDGAGRSVAFTGIENFDVTTAGQNDDIVTGSGGDNIILNAGDDRADAGGGNDNVEGGAGNDIVAGGAGGDTLAGGDGHDTLYAASISPAFTHPYYYLEPSFLPLLDTGAEADVLTGGGGNDTLFAGYGDTVTGGDGFDSLYVSFKGASSGVTADFRPFSQSGSGSATIGGATISGIDVVAWVEGSEFADVITMPDTGTANHPVYGRGGDDTIVGGSDGGNIYGGDGNDTIENTTSAYGGYLYGEAGDDVITDGIGNYLSGGDGNDRLYGRHGIDQAYGGSGNDIVDGGTDNDSLFGEAGNDTLYGNGDNDTIEGGDGDDTLYGDFTPTGTQNAYVQANQNHDRLAGGAGADALYGNEGGDLLDGGTGDDAMAGGTGDDIYWVDSAGDQVAEANAEGTDEVRTTLASYTLGANLENLCGDSLAGQSLTGNAGANVISATSGNDILDGGAGADLLKGGFGNDVFIVDNAGDQIEENGGAGTDEVRTSLATYSLGFGLENLTGTRITAQTLRGNSSDNVIRMDVAAGTFLLQDGGADRADGTNHDDVFYFGAAFDSADRANGGFGTDEAVLQGAYGPLTLVSDTLSGIQILTLLSAGDNRFGAAAAGAYSYDITIPSGFTTALFPGLDLFLDDNGELRIDASGLAAGETLTFDGSAANPAINFLSAWGGAGDDHLVGSAGGDDLRGNDGDDLIEGGDGNDYLDDNGGSGILRGGEGNDSLNFDVEGSRTWTTLSLEGGNGDDWASFYAGSAGDATIDTGAGNDRVYIRHLSGGSVRVTLGAGQDVLAVAGVPYLQAGNDLGEIVIADFQAGAGGDRFEWPADMGFAFLGWSSGMNPFADGYARLVQDGADTLLQVKVYPGSNSFETLVRFENRAPSDFTGENLGGFSPFPVTGGSGSDQLDGTPWSDFLFGEGGNDFFRLQQGGDDQASGGSGHDVFLFGATLTAADRVDGGEGRDQIAIQGNYSMTLGSGIVGVESIAILPGSDTRFGDPGTNSYDYDLTTLDVNVAAGVQMIVDASGLRVGEDFTFNGSAETNGSFFIYGGRGTDTLTGGSGNDAFYFGEGLQFGANDVVNGGPGGIDQLGLRGSYTVVFGAGQLIGIENIGLVSAQDTRFGPLGASYNYNLTMNDGNVVAGGQLTLDAFALRAGETLSFNGAAETNGTFRIFGGQGHDNIVGGAGNDTLAGNRGADNLTGGGGADTFRYNTAADSSPDARDHIHDFAPGVDKIDLIRIDADTHAAGDQAFHWIGTSAFTGSGAASAGELRAYLDNGNWFVEGDTDGNGIADLRISMTEGLAPLGAGDFLL